VRIGPVAITIAKNIEGAAIEKIGADSEGIIRDMLTEMSTEDVAKVVKGEGGDPCRRHQARRPQQV
jgi:hypothetical protein